uniref:Uncharacterized protein n=1 Tax=Tetranychus urticae TaxID=32264 RepID=T1JX43_TETUR
MHIKFHSRFIPLVYITNCKEVTENSYTKCCDMTIARHVILDNQFEKSNLNILFRETIFAEPSRVGEKLTRQFQFSNIFSLKPALVLNLVIWLLGILVFFKLFCYIGKCLDSKYCPLKSVKRFERNRYEALN